MARPRIFVSSTYYDLKHVRSELDRFIKDQGYEPVLNEFGHVPYGSEDELADYCYREIERCDILVAIIGGRFGSQSSYGEHSISNHELKTAHSLGKQIYIFIESAVFSEYRTYSANKGSAIKFIAVDNERIYNFLDEVFQLTTNNQIKSFDSTAEITSWLKEQWAGLFQRLLTEKSRQREINALEQINATAKTLSVLVEYLSNQKEKGDQAISHILLANHPIFDRLKIALNISFRVYFENKSEMDMLLSAGNYLSSSIKTEDMLFDSSTNKIEPDDYYKYESKKKYKFILINKSLFDKNLNLKNPEKINSDFPGLISGEVLPF